MCTILMNRIHSTRSSTFAQNKRNQGMGEGSVLRINETPGSVSDRQTHALYIYIFIFPVPPRFRFSRLPVVL
jgi:hypothetical protein